MGLLKIAITIYNTLIRGCGGKKGGTMGESEFLQSFSEPVAQLLGLISVGLLGYVAFRQRNRIQIRRHTVDLMVNLLTNEVLAEMYNFTNEHYKDGRPIPLGELDLETRNKLSMLLGFYEFLAIAYFKRHIDRSILEAQRKTGIRKTYILYKEYINDRRKTLGYKELYTEFERLARKFGAK